MSSVSFNSSIAQAKNLVEKCNLLSHVNTYVNIPSDYVGVVRDLPYHEQWATHESRYWYHIKLSDDSLLFFKEDSFKYMMSPYSEMQSQEEYEQNELRALTLEGYSESDALELVSFSLEKDYSDYVDTEASLRLATPVRLDIHPHQYHATHHPVTHLHIGHGNESRLPVKKIMTPYAFTSFVIATFYPEQWRTHSESEGSDAAHTNSMKNALSNVPHEYSDKWCSVFEESRFYLT